MAAVKWAVERKVEHGLGLSGFVRHCLAPGSLYLSCRVSGEVGATVVDWRPFDRHSKIGPVLELMPHNECSCCQPVGKNQPEWKN